MLRLAKKWAYEYICIFALIKMKQYTYSLHMYIYVYNIYIMIYIIYI